MNIDRVFIAIYRNSFEESLFCKRDNDFAYDLINKKNVYCGDLLRFISFKYFMNSDSSFKARIIDTYIKNRNELINIDNVYIGDVYKIIDNEYKLFEKNKLLYLLGDYINSSCFINLENNYIYNESNGFYISRDEENLRRIEDVVFDSSKVKKKSVLDVYRLSKRS